MIINEEVGRISKLISVGLTTTGEGVFTEKENSKLFEKSLPEDITIKDVKKVNDHLENFVAGATHAFGEQAIKCMKADKKIDRTSTSIKLDGRSSVKIVMDRKREYENRLPNADGTVGSVKKVVKKGVTTVNIHKVADKNTGQLKLVRDEMNKLAWKSL